MSACLAAISHQFLQRHPYSEFSASSWYPQARHPRQLVSLLLKDPSNCHAAQQVHSHVITSGFLVYPFYCTSSCLLLFNTLIRCNTSRLRSLGPQQLQNLMGHAVSCHVKKHILGTNAQQSDCPQLVYTKTVDLLQIGPPKDAVLLLLLVDFLLGGGRIRIRVRILVQGQL